MYVLYLSVCLSVYLSIKLIQSINLSVYQSIYQSIHRSIDPSIIDPSIHRSIDPSIHRSIDPSIHLSIYFLVILPEIVSPLDFHKPSHFLAHQLNWDPFGSVDLVSANRKNHKFSSGVTGKRGIERWFNGDMPTYHKR